MSGKTRSGEIFDALRSDILIGRFEPGEKLSPAAIADTFGVSLGVVREALTRLAEQNLVTSTPQIGFSVITISREDLLDLTNVRLEIETLALRHSVANGDVSWESELVAAHHVLERTPQMDPEDPHMRNEDWFLAHNRYHHLLLSACGSPRLLDIAEGLRDSADIYRRWSQPIGSGTPRDIPAEHRAILDAVMARDSDGAAQALSDHIAHTTSVLLHKAT